MIRGCSSAGRSRWGQPWSGKRWLLAGTAVLMACFAMAESSARIVSRVDPERALSIWPLNGRIQATASERLLADPLEAGAKPRAVRLARLALRHDPTAVEAVAVLAMQAQLAGRSEIADRLFSYAQGLSRRELSVQILAIQQAVDRGQIAAALLNYDIALRTSGRAEDLLFPVLTRAIAEPRVRAAVLDRLAARPVWTRGFINYLAVNVAEPRATVQFFREGTRIGLPILDAERVAVVNALVGQSLTEEAWSYYSSFRGNPDRRRSRDPRFTFVSDNPATFDWAPSNEAGLTASIQRGPHGGLVDFAAPAGVGGPLLRQTQLLPRGDYRLVGRSAAIDVAIGASPYWSLACLDGRELGRVAVPNSNVSKGAFAGVFRVPTGCPVQTLSLVARAVDGSSGLSGRIERVVVTPD